MSVLEVSPFHGIALYKSTFTYLLTMLSRDTLNTLYKFFPMLIAQLRKQPETARREAGVSATCRGLAADETDAGWFSLLVIPDPALP